MAREGQSIPIALALSSVRDLEVSEGQKSRGLMGAGIGLLVGAGATAWFLSQFCGGDTVCNGDEQVRAFVIIGLPVVAIGTVVGLLTRVERWKTVPLGPELSMRLEQRPALTASVSVHF